METTVTFDGGLNQDSAKLLRKQNTYFDARNIRVTTYEGSSNISVTNSKGNKLLATIPTAAKVYKITNNNLNPSTVANISISVNGINVIGVSLHETLANIVTTINNASTLSAFKAWLSTDTTYIYFTSINGTPITSFGISFSSGHSIVLTTIINPQSGLIPIGWVCIRDTIILITTNETSKTPAPTGGIGQIWKLTYDNITLAPTITLLYNNFLNLSTFYAIAPTAIQSRYENVLTQRIYWTDNNNQLRNFNTANPNGFIINPSQLNSVAPILTSIPILDTITTGTCTVGSYQASYRMKNGVTVTAWSELSNLIFLATSVAEASVSTTTDAPMNYIGANTGTATGKGFKMYIPNVDTSYERIEIVVLKRDTYNGTPTITITHDEFIVGNTFDFTYTGVENISALTPTEFFNQTFAFTHCKSLTVKDNKLIAANVRQQTIDFPYDARAYRFASASKDVFVDDAQGNHFAYPDPVINGWTQIPDTADAINTTPANNRYQYNSTTLGATGPNISYSFGTKSVMVDSHIALVSAGFQQSPFINRDQNYNEGQINLGVIGQDYNFHNTCDGVKFGYKSGLYQGYQRNEIYRFGITFFDRENKALFARWIGDIQMPDYGDVNPNSDACATANGIFDFRLGFQDTATYLFGPNSAWAQVLYVKFNVTIPTTIQGLIGGYRIVRVDRTKADRTILGTGILNTTYSDGAQLFIPNPNSNSDVISPDLNLSAESRLSGGGSPYNFTFDGPDFLLTDFPGALPGDKIVVCSTHYAADATDITPVAGADAYRIVKEYGTAGKFTFNSSANQYTVEEAAEIAAGGQYNFTGTTSTGFGFRNWCRVGGTALPTTSSSVGTKTLVLGLSTPLFFASHYGCTTGSYLKMYALYYRPSSGQYGGNSYSVRSHNTYMPCGSYQPIDDTTNVSSPFTQMVFGGDCWVDLYDDQKLLKNWGSYFPNQYTGPGLILKTSHTMIYPCESFHNHGLRHGIHMCHDLFRNTGTVEATGASLSETYDYNTLYSQVNNLTGYIPKPIDFVAEEEYDTRIWVSNQKQSGEVTDSWNIFLPANYYDADAAPGPINSIITFKDKVYFFQTQAFGYAPISERVIIQEDPANVAELQLGTTAEAIERPQYISRTTGSKHQWSVVASSEALYFFDITSRQICAYDGQQLKELPGLYGYLTTNLQGNVVTNDNPVFLDPTTLRAGIHSTVDYLTGDVFYTIFDSQPAGIGGSYVQFAQTIVYSEELGKYVSFMDFTPFMYINTLQVVISPDPINPTHLYIHSEGNYGTFYGTIFPSRIVTIINEHAKNAKMFTNLEWESEILDLSGPNPVNILGDTWNSVRCYNDFQNTDFVNIIPNITAKRRERAWRMPIPRNILSTTLAPNFDMFNPSNFNAARLFREPLRDKYITIDLRYSNLNNRRLICPLLTTKYLLSPR